MCFHNSSVFVGLTFILVRERICPPLTDARFQEQRSKELFFEHCFPASRVDGIRHGITYYLLFVELLQVGSNESDSEAGTELTVMPFGNSGADSSR